MFTGLVEEIGQIKKVEHQGDGIYLTVDAKTVLDGTATGDSISIDGVCQTVTQVGKGSFTVFCSRVTSDITTLAFYKPGRRVNLERAITLQSRIGGHIVQGHVDGTGIIKNVIKDENGIGLEISAPGPILRYVVQKGSIAIDGVSLTVVSRSAMGFKLYIIPETIQKTSLVEKRAGDEVNIETDILAKYIESIILYRNGKIDKQNDDNLLYKLAEEGFL
jgi:riboflavin synthase